jgi:6-phospho-3-hexuloisomerase
MVQEKITAIIKELNQVLSKIDEGQVEIFIETILKAKKIVVVGAGRVGLAARSFAQRLGHLGLSAYMIGDATVPGIGVGDLLIVASGSGETQTIFDLVSIAKINQATIALVTGNKDSRMGQLADIIIEVKAPSKVKQVAGLISIQPMTTLNEQSLWLFFDAIVLCMMDKMNESHETMWQRHSNLE